MALEARGLSENWVIVPTVIQLLGGGAGIRTPEPAVSCCVVAVPLVLTWVSMKSVGKLDKLLPQPSICSYCLFLM